MKHTQAPRVSIYRRSSRPGAATRRGGSAPAEPANFLVAAQRPRRNFGRLVGGHAPTAVPARYWALLGCVRLISRTQRLLCRGVGLGSEGRAAIRLLRQRHIEPALLLVLDDTERGAPDGRLGAGIEYASDGRLAGAVGQCRCHVKYPALALPPRNPTAQGKV